MESSRTGNYTRTVSCGQETPWSQVGQETFRQQFPVGKERHGAKSDRKPFANSFLPVRNTMEPRSPVISSGAKRSREISRRTVSCGQTTPWSQGGQETIREQFPVGKKRHGVKADRKPYANSFLWARNAMESRRTGNLSRTVSCGQETPWSQGGQETLREQFPVGKKQHGAKPNGKLYANSFLPV